MNQPWSSFIAGHLWKILSERTPLEKMISKGIHQSATPILISRMNDHAGRLIYNQYMFIFKNNIERNIFGLNISIARRFRKRDGDHIIRMDLVIGLNAFFIDFNKSLMNAILDFCTRDIRQSIHKKLVTNDIITNDTKTRSLIRPFSSATIPRIISIAPRAFMPHAAANDSRQLNPPRRVPSPLPIIFPAKAIAMMISVRSQSKLVKKFTRRPMEIKNNGAKMLLIN